MNFNSDFQSNQNRLRGAGAHNTDNEDVHARIQFSRLTTVTNDSRRKIVRLICEILFVLLAVSIGYIQALKTPVSYKYTKNVPNNVLEDMT